MRARLLRSSGTVAFLYAVARRGPGGSGRHSAGQAALQGSVLHNAARHKARAVLAPRRAAVWRAAWTCMALAQIVAPACTLGLGARLATGLAACWCDKWRGVCGAALTPSLHCVSTILHTSIVLHTDLSHIARARGQSTAQAHRDHVSDHGTWMCMIVDT